MKKIYIHKIYATLFLVPALCIGVPANAQKSSGNSAEEDNVHTGMERTKKAWEIGVGGTGLQMTRFNVINFQTNHKGGYTINTSKKDLLLEDTCMLPGNLTLIFTWTCRGCWIIVQTPYATDTSQDG